MAAHLVALNFLFTYNALPYPPEELLAGDDDGGDATSLLQAAPQTVAQQLAAGFLIADLAQLALGGVADDENDFGAAGPAWQACRTT